MTIMITATNAVDMETIITMTMMATLSARVAIALLTV